MNLTKGMTFSSYEEFENKFEKYCANNKVQFWKRESKLLTRTKLKRLVNVNEKLVYYVVKLCCIHGGRTFCKTATGQRNSKTLKQDCPAYVRLTLSKDGQHLALTNFNLEHNHIISENSYKLLPQQRRLPLAIQEKASQLLNMNVDKKVIKSQLMLETGKIILTKDLQNINNKFNNFKNTETLDIIIPKLRQKYRCDVNLLYDINKKLKGLFFQNKQMKDTFETYPEILLFEGPFRLFSKQVMYYALLIEDGNGNYEIVGAILMEEGNLGCLNSLIKTFCDNSEICSRIRIIMAEKDFVGRDILQQLFPEAKLLPSLFHVLKEFKHGLLRQKISLTSSQQAIAEEYVKNLFYSSSEKKYTEVYWEFTQFAPEELKTYYDENLHDIRHDWTFICHGNIAFLNTTYKAMKDVHSKLTALATAKYSLNSFLNGFFVLSDLLRTERRADFTESVLKTPTNSFEKHSPEEKYNKLLLPNPFHFLHGQLQSSKPNLVFEVAPGVYSYTHEDHLHTVNDFCCSCITYMGMRLPCKHIFAVRKALKLDMYDATLCDQRWTRQYSSKNQRIFVEMTDNPPEEMDYTDENSAAVETISISDVHTEYSVNETPTNHTICNTSSTQTACPSTVQTACPSTVQTACPSTVQTACPSTAQTANATTAQTASVSTTHTAGASSRETPSRHSTNSISANHSIYDAFTGHTLHVQSKTNDEASKSVCCCHKFTRCSLLTTELTSVLLQASDEEFSQKIKLMEDLLTCWKSGRCIVLAELGDSSNPIQTTEI